MAALGLKIERISSSLPYLTPIVDRSGPTHCPLAIRGRCRLPFLTHRIARRKGARVGDFSLLHYLLSFLPPQAAALVDRRSKSY